MCFFTRRSCSFAITRIKLNKKVSRVTTIRDFTYNLTNRKMCLFFCNKKTGNVHITSRLTCEFHGFLPCGNAVMIMGNRTFPERSDVDGCICLSGNKKNRQRPTFPGSFPPSIIGAKELNFCVRDGNRCVLPAIVTGFIRILISTFKPE